MNQGTSEFAVVDVETTGLFPGGADRILEIAVLRVHSSGEVLDEYCTLVNPNRDVGPTQVHGIRASDVRDAPFFEEIVGDVIQRLAGAVFVAHNARFDARFVRAEVRRAGHELPEFPQLCTLQLSRRVDSSIPSRRLADLCAYFGLTLQQSHSARDDACCTARLLAACLGEIGWIAGMPLTDIGMRGATINASRWPQLAPSGRSLRRDEAQRRKLEAPSYLGVLLGSLPVTTERPAKLDAYLALLDRVLEDRRVTVGEGDTLVTLAQDSQFSMADVAAAHDVYLSDLLHAALEDGRISHAEAEDLDAVRRLLGIGEQRAHELERQARETSSRWIERCVDDDLQGMSVCFTGALQCIVGGQRATRSQAEEAAVAAGMVVRKGVSKKLGLLVLADPDSMSGKAKRARALGVRLVAEPVFWRMVGVQVE